MKKYIDYLREQQGNKSSAAKDLENAERTNKETNPSAYNPYSRALSQSNSEPNIIDSTAGEQVAGQTNVTNDNALAAEKIISEKDIAEEVLQPKMQVAVTFNQQLLAPDNNEPHFATTLGDTNTHFDTSSWLQGISETTREIFHHAEKNETTDIAPLYEHLKVILDQIASMPNELHILELEVHQNIAAVRALDKNIGGLLQKSIMMMLYTVKTGLQLKAHPEKLLHLIVVSMLHHIGMVRIPVEIRKKKDKLSMDEINRIKQAPVEAKNYLEACQVEESVSQAVAQAAERYDGSGPLGLVGHDIVWAARLIGLLSMFEALIHFRPYRKRLLPRDAISKLVKQHKECFDPQMLKVLIEAISLYPVGTFVQLNTGEIGLVTTVHNNLPLRPIIHITFDQYGGAIPERTIDLKFQSNMAIRKCTYKESVEELFHKR